MIDCCSRVPGIRAWKLISVDNSRVLDFDSPKYEIGTGGSGQKRGQGLSDGLLGKYIVLKTTDEGVKAKEMRLLGWSYTGVSQHSNQTMNHFIW